jgi:AraC family transcriptional regulator of adaptative response / DNA-3-methyladenine glycosylase II
VRRLRLQLPFLPPLEPSNLFGHLAATAVPGVEEWRDGRYRAAVLLPGGPAIIAAAPPVECGVPVDLLLSDPADEAEALTRTRRLLDLDLEPWRMAAVLGSDPVLAPLVAAVPGRRVPGTLDPMAMVLRAVLGQQIATAAARTLTGRLVAAVGEPIDDPAGGLTHLFPAARAIVREADRVRAVLRMPESRRRTVLVVAAALAHGAVDLTATPAAVRAALLALPGVGPWTADTVRMRALGDADAFLAGDLGVVLAARRLGLPDRAGPLERRSLAWSPYRAHAVQYLWATGEHPVNSMPG